jgi:hypothetical protein
LAFVRALNYTNIATGDLTPAGRKQFSTVPLTLNEGLNNFLDWTADSKNVLFASDRNGKWQIFLQPVGAESARSLVAGPAAEGLSPTTIWGAGAKLSPNDQWLLYFVNDSHDTPGKTQVLMRVPVGDGIPEPIARAGRAATLACSKVKGGSCIIEERTPDQKEIVFTDLKPLTGRGPQIARIGTASLPHESLCGLDDVCYPWSLSPGGETIAVHGHMNSHFELISTKTARQSSLTVNRWSILDVISWSPDQSGFFVSAMRGQDVFVLHVGLNGATHVIFRQTADCDVLPFPSPDSRLLAVQRWRASRNVWMIDNF